MDDPEESGALATGAGFCPVAALASIRKMDKAMARKSFIVIALMNPNYTHVTGPLCKPPDMASLAFSSALRRRASVYGEAWLHTFGRRTLTGSNRPAHNL